MDVLSDVLKVIRLDGAVYLNAEFSAPWCVEAQYGLHTAASKLPQGNHIVFFHFLLDGRCSARLADGSETVELATGDVILFPHDSLHLMGSDPRLVPAASEPVLERSGRDGLVQMKYGGSGEKTHFVCGYLACDRRICRPLFSSLPEMLRVPLGGTPATAWILELLRVGVQESLAQNPGARSLLSKLSELMFVEAMRRHALSLPADQKGWLAGLRDPYVGRVLGLMHTRPADAWTVDALARKVALSRSALAERFTDLIGEPPMQYLTRWRLALAAQALQSGSEGIASIAARCGYDSEPAFNRAFKREFDTTPAAWRKNSRSGAQAAAPARTRNRSGS